ncbi:MAG: YebC/PmpR family DNA-binding transcriptional regulator, partial [Actinomycetota bacterium]
GGGGILEGTPTLATAVAKAKASSVPNDNITRAIKRGTGELQGESYDEISYEGYGPGGVAVLVHCLTNNRNRASQDVRGAFNASGGKMAEPGAVAWMFEQKGVVVVEASSAGEDDVFLVAADAGAEDVRSSDDSIEVITPPEAIKAVADALSAAGIDALSAEVTQVPKTTVEVGGSDAKRLLALLDSLDELDDVQDVYANFDISAEVMAALAG